MRNFWARPSNHWPENSHIGQVSFLLVKPLKHAKPCSCQWEILSDGKSSFIISHRPHLFCFLKFLFTLVGCLANAQTHDCILLGLSSHIGWTNQIKSNKYWSHQPVLLLIYTYNVLLSNPKTWVTDPTGICLEIGERFGMVNTTMSEHSCWLDELLWAVSQVDALHLACILPRFLQAWCLSLFFANDVGLWAFLGAEAEVSVATNVMGEHWRLGRCPNCPNSRKLYGCPCLFAFIASREHYFRSLPFDRVNSGFGWRNIPIPFGDGIKKNAQKLQIHPQIHIHMNPYTSQQKMGVSINGGTPKWFGGTAILGLMVNDSKWM